MHADTTRLPSSPANAERLLGAIQSITAGGSTMADKYTIYAGEPLAKLLTGYQDQRSGRVNQVAADYLAMVRDVMPELTREEWCAVMDATNGLYVLPGDDATYRFTWAEIADAQGLGEKWGIDQQALATRLRVMGVAELVAVAEASRTFWQHPEADTDVALRLAGVRITTEADRRASEPDEDNPEAGPDFFARAQPARPPRG